MKLILLGLSAIIAIVFIAGLSHVLSLIPAKAENPATVKVLVQDGACSVYAADVGFRTMHYVHCTTGTVSMFSPP